MKPSKTAPASPIQFAWADLSEFNPDPSLGTVIRLSQINLTNLTIADGSTITNLSNETIFTCTIDARWAPVQFYLQLIVDATGHPDTAYPDFETPHLTQIQIDPAWAESLNFPVPGSNLKIMEMAHLHLLPCLIMKVQHYGYGYSAATITAKIAIGAILLHAAVAIGHIIVVCFPWKGDVWTSDAWGTVGGLVVLAMNSRPNERLPNMSASIN